MLKVKDGVNGNSTTATTLQTARTINGTSFNGSANITTANWGTARTLTIGSTGKSVNGSANISWTLTEIGAMGTVSANGYYGLALPDKTTSNWIRTTVNGIIPYQSGGASALGTSSWPFNNAYINIVYGNLSGNATTATTLQTARTINGTSFNGSTNITTTNWGTARTITIGNTGKSVNGSANISWSLSEIGAAATSHTHSYLPLSGGTLTGETIFNNYLSINAWSGYGTGKAQLWYNGNTKSLLLQPPVEDIQINGKYVYHQGRIPSPDDIGALPITGGTVLGTLLVDKDLYVGENAVFRTFQAQVGQTIEIRCHLTPNTNEWWNLGQSHSMFGDIYSRRGALNGSDISFKENIKDIAENNKLRTFSNENEYDSSVTLSDLYEYVKNINIKSFNYKNTDENILGIIANDIPDNIFNKIGIINDNNERIIFATAQIAMLQGALKEAINKIEGLQNEIELIKDGVN